MHYGLLKETFHSPTQQQTKHPTSVFCLTLQLLVALDALKGLGILHTDIKPENIMCVNQLDQPFKVKLIDFGLAITSSKVQTGLVIQPVGYRYSRFN